MKIAKLVVAGAFLTLCTLSISGQYVAASTEDEEAMQYEQTDESYENSIVEEANDVSAENDQIEAQEPEEAANDTDGM